MRYFFDTADGDLDCDADGVDLSDDNAARGAAVRYLSALLMDKPDHVLGGLPLIVSVRNERGETVTRIEAREGAAE